MPVYGRKRGEGIYLGQFAIERAVIISISQSENFLITQLTPLCPSNIHAAALVPG